MTEKKHNPFKLRDFRDVDPECVAKLEHHGIKNAEQLLAAGCTKKQRSTLAREVSIPVQVLLELVKLSDLARLPGVKGIRARLYYDAGVDSVQKLAAWDPEALRMIVTRYAEQTGFEGIPPLPKEIRSTVANAQKLPKVVEE